MEIEARRRDDLTILYQWRQRPRRAVSVEFAEHLYYGISYEVAPLRLSSSVRLSLCPGCAEPESVFTGFKFRYMSMWMAAQEAK